MRILCTVRHSKCNISNSNDSHSNDKKKLYETTIENSLITCTSTDTLFTIGLIHVIKIVFEKHKMNELYTHIMFFLTVVKVHV